MHGETHGLMKAIPHGGFGECDIVLEPAEPLFLSGGEDIAVQYKCGCAVVIKGGDS
jgi:hypothetical protein